MTDREKLEKAIERRQLHERERRKHGIETDTHPEAPDAVTGVSETPGNSENQ
ncbi:hypothetical protein [Aurantimonas coralicida]|uniref:hypothetical protein n=1 Tax=Aurantimonas coralicida TaxID=182270 RepID=UPI001E398DD7|nr:hypothetical protein [Aurantimonas coralicida]MCD1644951.1 hypothetical protein [Aurantimonas coralicida]